MSSLWPDATSILFRLRQVATPQAGGGFSVVSSACDTLGVCIVLRGDRVAALVDGDTAEAPVRVRLDELRGAEGSVDCGGRSAVPGLVDAHTHAVFAGDRVAEFGLKLRGATYMDIYRSGGGIHSTVRHTRAASEEELAALLSSRLDRMIRLGTTLAEVKSGYGLEAETEAKMLRVAHSMKGKHPVELCSTFCGAHAVPVGSTAAEAARSVITEQLPAILADKAAGRNSVENVDVFYEKGVFEEEETAAVLAAGSAAGLAINFHGDELHPMRSGVLGAKWGARAISHLEEVSSEDVAAMAAAGVYAVLLPTTAYVLRLKYPPARDMIAAGVRVALGSDFNPNAFCMSMPYVMNLACINMRLTTEEALTAATLHAAASLNKEASYGSIEPGKFADIVVVDAPSWEHIIYQFGDSPIHAVFKKGVRVAL
jgi:imidazolonepropionase